MLPFGTSQVSAQEHMTVQELLRLDQKLLGHTQSLVLWPIVGVIILEEVKHLVDSIR